MRPWLPRALGLAAPFVFIVGYVGLIVAEPESDLALGIAALLAAALAVAAATTRATGRFAQTLVVFAVGSAILGVGVLLTEFTPVPECNDVATSSFGPAGACMAVTASDILGPVGFLTAVLALLVLLVKGLRWSVQNRRSTSPT